MNIDAISYRAETEEDKPFLSKLYASSRADEFALTGWPQEQIDQLLSLQFAAQYNQYHSKFFDAEFRLIILDNKSIGRVCIHRNKEQVAIIDIALLPELCGRGLGSRILSQIILEAKTSKLPVRIHVLHNNPALSLYNRLGFIEIEDKGAYLLMEKPS